MYYEKIANFRNIEIKYAGNSRKSRFIYESSRQFNIKSPHNRGLLSVYIDEQTTPKCATIKCKYIIIYLTNCINNFVKKLKYKKTVAYIFLYKLHSKS